MGWWGGAGRAALRRLLRGPAGSGPRYSLGRAPPPPPPPPPPPAVTDLDRADAALLGKALESALLSWFRNGLLATGIGVICYVQSDTGRDAAYGFFLLGGVSVGFGAASFARAVARLRRPLLLPRAAALARGTAAAALPLLWLAALGLYLGRLEVEIVAEDPPEE